MEIALEFGSCARGVLFLSETVPQEDLFIQVDKEEYLAGLEIQEHFAKSMHSWFPPNGIVQLCQEREDFLKANDVKMVSEMIPGEINESLEAYNCCPIHWPALVAKCGSALSIIKVGQSLQLFCFSN